MGKLSNIIPVSDLRRSAAKLLTQLRNSKDPLIITQRGRAAAVIVGVDAYEKIEHEKELLLLLAKGQREIETGEGYDLDTVLAEADVIWVVAVWHGAQIPRGIASSRSPLVQISCRPPLCVRRQVPCVSPHNVVLTQTSLPHRADDRRRRCSYFSTLGRRHCYCRRAPGERRYCICNRIEGDALHGGAARNGMTATFHEGEGGFEVAVKGAPSRVLEVCTYVAGAILLCIGLLLAAVYVPVLSSLLRTQEPGPQGWLLLLSMSLIPYVWGQTMRVVQAERSKIKRQT